MYNFTGMGVPYPKVREETGNFMWSGTPPLQAEATSSSLQDSPAGSASSKTEETEDSFY